MKKTIFFTASLIASLALVGTVAHSQPRSDGWAFWGGTTLEEKELDASYQLPVKGWDTRVYEWTPEGAPAVTCVAQFSSSGPVGMQCFRKWHR